MFTLRVCISGLCLIIPTNDGRLKVLMPTTGPGHPAKKKHQALMRFDDGHLTQGGSPGAKKTIPLDTHTVVIPDGASGQLCAWRDAGLLNLSLATTYGKHAGPGLINGTPGNDLSCVVTVPPSCSQCITQGNWWNVKGKDTRVAWLIRRDIQYDTDSVTIFGQTLYPFGGGIDVTIVNEPTTMTMNPGGHPPMPHVEGLFALLGINDPVPTFVRNGDPSKVCDGWIARPGQAAETDAFQCMPAVATP